MDYIAVGGFPDTAENCRRRDQTYPLGKQDSHPNVIQIWNVHCGTDEEGTLQGDPDVYMALCILHGYGAVLDMKWCPNGNLMEAVRWTLKMMQTACLSYTTHGMYADARTMAYLGHGTWEPGAFGYFGRHFLRRNDSDIQYS